jgi:hypothetical protein
MGKIRVWDIDLKRTRWTVDEVVSKCYIWPDDPKQAEWNPLPDEVREEIGNSDSNRFSDAYVVRFPPKNGFSWRVHSLLLPSDETIARMVLDDLDVE